MHDIKTILRQDDFRQARQRMALDLEYVSFLPAERFRQSIDTFFTSESWIFSLELCG